MVSSIVVFEDYPISVENMEMQMTQSHACHVTFHVVITRPNQDNGYGHAYRDGELMTPHGDCITQPDCGNMSGVDHMILPRQTK